MEVGLYNKSFSFSGVTRRPIGDICAGSKVHTEALCTCETIKEINKMNVFSLVWLFTSDTDRTFVINKIEIEIINN